MELIDKVAEALEDYGVLYGDLVDNDDGTVSIVGVDESEWDDAASAIEDCLGISVSLPPRGHADEDDEIIVLGQDLADDDADGIPEIPSAYDLDVLRKIKDMVPNDAFAYIKNNHGGNHDLAMMYLDYSGYGNPDMEIVLKKALGESLCEDDREGNELETFDEKMDFLAKDEQEAIDGYDKVIAMLNQEEDAVAIEQLTKIKVEEEAHKKFLEDVKGDHELVYTEPLEPEEAIEEGKTSSQRYNDRMSKIFDRADKANLAMKAFLIKNGVSEEEAEELYRGTGLHGNPLHQKMIDMGIADDFFSKYDFDSGALHEDAGDISQFNVGDEWDWADDSFVKIDSIEDGKYSITAAGNVHKVVSKDELANMVSTGKKVIGEKLDGSKLRKEYVVLSKNYEDIEWFDNQEDAVKYADEHDDAAEVIEVVSKELDDGEREYLDDVERTVWLSEGANYKGLAFYEYPKGSGFHVRETPSSFVALDDHGTTLGDSKTKAGAEAIIDGKIKDAAQAKKGLDEDIDADLLGKLEDIYRKGDLDFMMAPDEDGEQFVIVYGWDDVQDIQKALDPSFEPKDKYDSSLLDKAMDGNWGFSDEYSVCDECGHVIKTTPDSYSWKPDFFVDYEEGTIHCGDCVRKDPEGYLNSLINNPDRANTILSPKELEGLGFQRIGQDYQAGWYDRNDNPKDILGKAMDEQPNASFIFSIKAQGQFATDFELWGKGLEVEENLTEGRYADLKRLWSERKDELKDLHKKLKACKSDSKCEEIMDAMEALEAEIGDIEGEMAEIRYLDNGSSSDYNGFESLCEGVSLNDPSLKKGIAYLNRNRGHFGYICSYLDGRNHQKVAVNKGFKTEKELMDYVARIVANKDVTDVSVIRQGEQDKYKKALKGE